jgi:hypothetical protein
VHQASKGAEESDIDFDALGLKYPVKLRDPVVERFQWTPPPEAPPALPFQVERTAGGFMPVYTDYIAGNTKCITMIRKCSGDIEALKEELEKVTGQFVTVRPGKIFVEGNYDARLKKWLTGLGF